jgi:hypothetical protein
MRLKQPTFRAGTIRSVQVRLMIVVLLLGFPIALMLAGDVCVAVAIIDTAQTRQNSAL